MQRIVADGPMHKTHALLVEMAELGLDPTNVSALLLLPLVHVAWADRQVKPAEREAILAFGDNNELLTPAGRGLVERWLDEAPSAEFRERGLALVVQLAWDAGTLSPDVTIERLDRAVDYCTVVGLAAGTWFRRSDLLSGADLDATQEVTETIARLHQEFGPEDGAVGRPISPDWAALLDELATRHTTARRAPTTP